MDRGGREGLLLEADGTVAEGAATAVLWQEGELCTPRPGSALPSVTVAGLRRRLASAGAGLNPETRDAGILAAAQGVWLANSLMGLLPVSSLDGQPLAVSGATARLNELLWSETG